MTPEELALELRAGGLDPEKRRRSSERATAMIRDALAKVEAAERSNTEAQPPKSLPAAAPVVSLPRRRVLRWSLLVAALIAAALAALPAIEMLARDKPNVPPRNKAPRVMLVQPQTPPTTEPSQEHNLPTLPR
jgi:hypothetical protein